MKKVLLLLPAVVFLSILTVSAQIRKIPQEVTEALKNKFPDAQKVEWKDKLTNFQADFTWQGAEWTAEFTGKGEWIESNKKLSFDALPAAVKDGFKKSKFNDWTPGSVTWIEKSDNTSCYKIYVEKSAVQKMFLFFSKAGVLERESPGV